MTLLTSKQKRYNQIRLISIGFYAITGALLLAFLPLTGFPPHLGLLGIVSLITAYSTYANRAWAPWLTFILLIANTTFCVVTLYSVALSNLLVTAMLLPLLLLTWFVTVEQRRKKLA